jgi:hypothetical protein
MSDERPVYARWRYPFAEILGKKILIIEFFEARHWRLRYGMDVWPSPKDVPAVDWSRMYRLRINGIWYGDRKYSFFTKVQAAMLVERLLETKVIDINLIELKES